jgi:hypothetical protein
MENFLSYGGSSFSEELLTPNVGFILSPDGKKISVIDDDKMDSPYLYYDEETQQWMWPCGLAARLSACASLSAKANCSPKRQRAVSEFSGLKTLSV